MAHTFHECTLRSSSLIIVHKHNQSIVTATDAVFQYLGYSDPHQLLGRSAVQLLNPRHFQNDIYLLQRYDNSDKLFQLCVHHDPFNANSNHLEYWLLKPLVNTVTTEESALSIMRLSTFGTIDYACLSPEFPQTLYELYGHPIMSYIHSADVLLLCEKLKQCRIYDTFPIRWLNKHPRHHNDENDFMWISLTVIHSATTKQHCDTQTRPLCILRPFNHDTTTTFRDLLSHYFCGTLIDSIHLAIDQGKAYLIEYFAFIIAQALEAVSIPSQQDMTSALLSYIKETIDNYIYWPTTRTITKKK